MFVTLKLLVLTAALTSLEFSLEKKMIIPGDILSAFPEWDNSSMALSATNLVQQLLFPISLPSNFPFESCSSWCFGISQLWWCSSPSTAPIFACFAGVLPAGTCNLWDGLTSAPVELVALLSLVLAEREREVVCWMKAPARCELGVTAGTRILRRREGRDYWETKYQGSFISKTTLNLTINSMFSSWFWWSFWCLPNTTPVSDLFDPSFSQRSRIIHCWAVLSTDKEQSLCNRWPLLWMFEAGNQVFSLILSKQNTEFCNLDTLVSAFFSPHLTPCVWHLDTLVKEGWKKEQTGLLPSEAQSQQHLLSTFLALFSNGLIMLQLLRMYRKCCLSCSCLCT